MTVPFCGAFNCTDCRRGRLVSSAAIRFIAGADFFVASVFFVSEVDRCSAGKIGRTGGMVACTATPTASGSFGSGLSLPPSADERGRLSTSRRTGTSGDGGDIAGLRLLALAANLFISPTTVPSRTRSTPSWFPLTCRSRRHFFQPCSLPFMAANTAEDSGRSCGQSLLTLSRYSASCCVVLTAFCMSIMTAFMALAVRSMICSICSLPSTSWARNLRSPSILSKTSMCDIGSFRKPMRSSMSLMARSKSSVVFSRKSSMSSTCVCRISTTSVSDLACS